MAGNYSTIEARLRALELENARLRKMLEEALSGIQAARQQAGAGGSTPFNTPIGWMHGVVTVAAPAAPSGTQLSVGTMEIMEPGLTGALSATGKFTDFWHKSTSGGVIVGKRIGTLPHVVHPIATWEECP